jgi:hypothetical protein
MRDSRMGSTTATSLLVAPRSDLIDGRSSKHRSIENLHSKRPSEDRASEKNEKRKIITNPPISLEIRGLNI